MTQSHLPGRLASAGDELRAIEQLSPELVLVSPELRSLAAYGPYVPRRPPRIEPLGSPLHAPPRGPVQLTVRLPLVPVLIAGTIAKVAFQAATIVLGFAVLVALLALVARI